MALEASHPPVCERGGAEEEGGSRRGGEEADGRAEVSGERLLLVVRLKGRPPTANKHRSGFWTEAAEDTRRIRAEAAWWVKLKRPARPGPECFPVIIEAHPHYQNRRWWPDVGACSPGLKAAVDGLVDAGWLPGDTDQFVGEHRYKAPVVTGHDGLMLRVLTSEEEVK